METNCPQCNSTLNSPSFRLVQDSCGHKKCRMCLLQDESDCKMCLQIKENDSIVIKYENIHPTVITCNKFKLNYNSDSKTDVLNDESKQAISKVDKKKVNEKKIYNSVNLPSYITIVTENPLMYKCNFCNKRFRTKSHIKYHSYCSGDQKPLHCEKCDKKFISKYHLEIHLLGHSGKRQFTCDVCNKGFKQYGILSRHKLIHSDLKQFVCPQCGKMFKSKDYLQRHSLIHQVDKPFKCKQCDAKFNNRSNLNQHQATHIKEKVHMCDECGKRFKLKGALTVHRRSHSRLRPHKCTTCLKTFINSKELQRHKLIHIDSKLYVCSLCSVSFRRKDNLQRHVRNTHPGKKNNAIKKPNKRVRLKPVKTKLTENPNAINVITASPINKTQPLLEPVLSKPVPVINAPLKLAFKTTAFKSYYNIHSREYVEPSRIQPKPYDYEESVSICQKILSPSSPPPPRTIIKTLGNVSEQESNEICQKILSPLVTPANNEMSFDKPYSIRNIKFKLPSKYVNLSKKNIFNDIATTQSNEIVLSEENQVYSELKPLLPRNAASVIVNSNSLTQNEVHWRRRTLQNLESQSKTSES